MSVELENLALLFYSYVTVNLFRVGVSLLVRTSLSEISLPDRFNLELQSRFLLCCPKSLSSMRPEALVCLKADARFSLFGVFFPLSQC